MEARESAAPPVEPTLSAADNPLLEIEFRIPFDRIRAEHVEPALEALIRDSQERLAELARSSGPRTFENTLLAMERATERLDFAMTVVTHLEAVATYPAFREVYNKMQPVVSEFYSRIPLDAGLWRVLKEYAGTDEARALTGVRRRFLEKQLRWFRRHGAELDEAGKKRLAEIEVELAKLTNRFSQNVLDATNQFELILETEQQLAGLPPTAIEEARESARQKGKAGWRFTLQEPSYVAVMTYLDDAAVREHCWRAFNNRAAQGELDNAPLIARILELRREKANLLGFAHFADLVLEERMAKSGRTAQEFVADLRRKTEARFEQEKQELLAFRRQVEGPEAPELAPWDTGYWAEKQRAALYRFKEEDLRPYFAAGRVIEGMYAIAERIFGVRVEPEAELPVWHEAVRCYSIRDRNGEHLGSFYADWHPRESKRGGAWMDAFLTGEPGRKGFESHLGLICGNLTPPVGDKPALLTHREVETIFHEFGHLLHHCLSRVEIKGLAGTRVAWDFVELPSQIMENWCWEREALDFFARHWKTGEPIPEELFEKMRRARTFRAATAQMRQLGFGALDLALHIDYDPEKDGDALAYARRILQEYTPARLPEEYGMVASFRHLFADPVGYGAGYYSYKWAEVLDADAFRRFLNEGILNPEVGLAFRDRILARGDSEDPGELFRSFMGRDPDPTALLERSGLLPRAA